MDYKKINSLIVNIYNTVHHGECFCEKEYLDDLKQDVRNLLGMLENYQIEDLD